MLVRLFIFFVVCWAAVIVFAPMPPKQTAPTATTTTPPVPATTTACDLGQGPCSFDFDETHGLSLSIAPRPIRVVTPLAVGARFRGRASRAVVTFTSTTMDMGTLRVELQPQNDGLFVAQTALPLCTTATMKWQARIDVDLDGEAHHAVFGFTTERSTTAPADAGAPDAASVFTPVDAAASATVVDGVFQAAAGPVSLQALRGKLVLVTFGYTSCPDVCPMGLSALAKLLSGLSDDERARLEVLFVSVDPARDSLPHLATYGAHFHPAIRGVSADEATLRSVAASLGVVWQRVGTDGGAPPTEGFLIDHTAFVSVLSPEGRLLGRLAHAADASASAVVVRRFLPGASP
jgi:protein SCO1/2